MASDVLLITTEYFKLNTSVNHEVDSDLLEPAIILASDKYILPILGSTLYNRILADVRANTLVGNYSALTVNYIQPCLAQFSLYEALPSINFRVTNINLGKKSNDTSQPSTMEEVDYICRKVYNNGGFYAERLTRYLRANDTLFSEYVNYSANADTIPPAPTQYFSGIHIPTYLPYGGATFGQDLVGAAYIRNLVDGLGARTPWTF